MPKMSQYMLLIRVILTKMIVAKISCANLLEIY